MKPRGRVSKAAKSVTVIAGGRGARPAPPPELTERQAAIWREVVDTEDREFFRTAGLRALLADYCRRRDASEGISAVINSFKPEWLKTGDGLRQYRRLLNLRDLECRGTAMLATKLRLTNQARYMPRAAASAARNAPFPGRLPWERGDEPA